MAAIITERETRSQGQQNDYYPDGNGRNGNGSLSLDELENLRARQHVEQYCSLVCTPSESITLERYPELGNFVDPLFIGVHPLVLRFRPNTLEGLDHYFAIVVQDRQRHTDEMLGKR